MNDWQVLREFYATLGMLDLLDDAECPGMNFSHNAMIWGYGSFTYDPTVEDTIPTVRQRCINYAELLLSSEYMTFDFLDKHQV